MNLPLRGVAVYNPALLSKDELVAQFIARKGLLDTILSELRTQERPDHRVLLGPRGMGKTTLLRRIYFAVEDDPALSKKWIALPFPEEQYNLTRLSDFYLNCIDALGDALVHLGREAEAEALDRARDALPVQDEKERETAARNLLLSMADKLDRRLLLLVDSVEMVLDRLGASQWALRELLGHDKRLCLIGASAFAPESTFEYKQAFYEFFRFHELRPLQETEAKDLLLHLAHLRDAPEIERIVKEEPARVRTLLTLSGGNPRTLVQLYGVLSQSAEGDARSDLERLLDECTPIYKARFEALSVQAQQIVDAVALHWHPVTAADVAAATRLDVNVVTSQLNRLGKDGVLEAVQAPEGTKKAHQIAERFFNIWYLMRASRRQRQRLVWLVEFLRLLYSHEELPAHALRALGRESLLDARSVGREAEYRMALALAVENRALRRALVSSALRPWSDLEGHSEGLSELLDLAPEETPAKPIADRQQALANLRRKVLKAKVKQKGWNAAEFWDLLGGSKLPLERKIAMVERIERAAPKTLRTWMSRLQQEEQAWKKTVRCDVAVDALRRALREGDMTDADDFEGGEAASLRLGCPELKTLVLGEHVEMTEAPSEEDLRRLERALEETPHVAHGWYVLAGARQDRGEHAAAEKLYRTLLQQDPGHARGWRDLGILLYLDGEPAKADDAEAALRRSIEADPENSISWRWLGRVLSEHADRSAEAESAYRRAMFLDGSDPWIWIYLGDLLSTDRPQEAEAASRRATEIEPEMGPAWHILARALETQGRYSEAEAAYQRATTANTSSPWAWLDLGDLRHDHLKRPVEAKHAYRSALAFEDTRPFALFHLTHERWSRGLIDAETEELAREMVRLDPDPVNKLLLASVLVGRGLWDEPARLARDVVTTAAPKDLEDAWDWVLVFFGAVVRSRGAADALRLLDDLGLSERWLPLRAALTALRDGKRALAGFAPEVRRPAEALLARFERHPEPAPAQPDPPSTEAPPLPTPAAPAKTKSPSADAPASPTKPVRSPRTSPSPARQPAPRKHTPAKRTAARHRDA